MASTAGTRAVPSPGGNGGTMRRSSPGALTLPLSGAFVVVASVWWATRLAGDPRWHHVDGLGQRVPGTGHSVRVLREISGPAVVPVLGVLLAVLLVIAWRRSRRDAATLAVVAVGASATVQLLGPSTVPVIGDVGALSGHIGVAGAVCLGWLVVTRTRSVAWTAGPAVVVMGAVVVAMVQARWHSLPEVVASVGVATGWAIAALGMSPPLEGRSSLRSAAVAGSGILLGATGLAVTTVLGGISAAQVGPEPVGLVTVAGLSVVVMAVGTVFGGRLALDAWRDAPDPGATRQAREATIANTGAVTRGTASMPSDG